MPVAGGESRILRQNILFKTDSPLFIVGVAVRETVMMMISRVLMAMSLIVVRVVRMNDRFGFAAAAISAHLIDLHLFDP
ncbi:hypothetical protein BN873_720012 [Candidatus Competibacter denitrificans Run_A_D11]|uniref:Uncharacterized protein n=1 Tax=Candidatus Competibacter denitrificans Run_A_D11 TaxID=1400863 RepID=W6ME34_9GAMM|nr:hypothetical protein BN873_720012 [Candidatus Competibacter denitrificans Run_A_D11]